jgi:hypothetical protein
MAIYAAPAAPASGGADLPNFAMDTSSRQTEVWKDVARTQRKLQENVGAPVASPLSQSSLQLALENEKLIDAKKPYLKALADAAAKENDIVGYVFAVNGKINSGDVYPSNGLFKKMWSKLLNSSVTEAIGEKNGEAGQPPSTTDVLAFIDEAEKGKANIREVNDGKIETRESLKSIYSEAARPDGAFLHRSYILKGE